MSPAPNGRCIVVGDAMMDVTARIASSIELASDTPAQVTVQPGGSAANTAAWMAASGQPAWFVGCLGDDAFGKEIRATFDAVGVQTQLTVSLSKPTGTCVIIVDEQHERTMFPDKGANDDLDHHAVLELDLGPADHVHMSAYVLLNPHTRDEGVRILEYARSAGATTSLDAASAGPLRAQAEFVTDTLGLFTLLIANADEARVLSRTDDVSEALRVLLGLVESVVIKRGADGVIAGSAAEDTRQPALPAHVVDTTGAGDAFAAAFLTTWLASGSLDDAVTAGQELAAQAVGRVGASPLTR